MEADKSGWHEIVNAPDGGKLAVMSAQTQEAAYVPLPGGEGAVFQGSTLVSAPVVKV